MAPTSRIDSRGRTRLPREVRERLGLKPGDRIAFVSEGEAVRLVRDLTPGEAYLRSVQATLCEWDSAEYEAAFFSL
jgi:AbrB family looped-hinge helix DNA binding protein